MTAPGTDVTPPAIAGSEPWRSVLPAGFAWPAGIRAAACFTFDVDAESPILFDHPEAAGWLDVMSHQAYGPRTAVPRILRLLDRQGIRATFFVPGYSAERWPEAVRSTRATPSHGIAPSPQRSTAASRSRVLRGRT